jgi:cytochrome P450
MISKVPETFVQPDDFITERWATKPELLLDTGAYATFSFGTSKYPFCVV